MTAIRHFPNTPLRHTTAAPWRWQAPAWLLSAWQTMERFGYRRAAWELEIQARHRDASDPQMARQLRATADTCRRAALPTSARSGS